MQVFEMYKYPILGGIFGFILALLLLTLGIFKTLLLTVLVIIGAGAGWYLRESGLLESFLNNHRK
ncbi:DUF2273 domain-containing protein [Streptococcus sp. X16XC17]|uniref:DUF2273 domain-containing protein n=1 Tax=unclassified Streptococcus TaxID=2608887 RepID=UPI00066FBFF3|nr:MULTISPECIES: DUF2273 domain-containing protein [unclassified Streptococcus]TCD45935.1 DUF2273 domain-containing protein [Streptococcus sp. X16XC17]